MEPTNLISIREPQPLCNLARGYHVGGRADGAHILGARENTALGEPKTWVQAAEYTAGSNNKLTGARTGKTAMPFFL